MDQTEAARPYLEALASTIASPIVATLLMVSVEPKVFAGESTNRADIYRVERIIVVKFLIRMRRERVVAATIDEA